MGIKMVDEEGRGWDGIKTKAKPKAKQGGKGQGGGQTIHLQQVIYTHELKSPDASEQNGPLCSTIQRSSKTAPLGLLT